jgi:hypothetical protein
MCRQILVKPPNIKFHKNLSRESNPETRSQPDMLKLAIAYYMLPSLKLFQIKVVILIIKMVCIYFISLLENH